jgi:ribosomal protein L16 Arg81 hydroxylase
LTLTDVIAPVSVSDFLRSYLGQDLLHVRGTPDKFTRLLQWSGLNEVLNHHQFTGQRLRIVREGKVIPSSEYLASLQYSTYSALCPIANRLEQYLRDGATLVVDGVDRMCGPVGELAEHAERLLGMNVNVNAYAGWKDIYGFDLHRDEHDVLILQISGTKRWQVYGRTRNEETGGRESEAQKPGGDPVWMDTLSAGHVLYLPRGWWHVAIPCGEPTLHLTMGLNGHTGVDIIRWLTQTLMRQDVIQRYLPLWSGKDSVISHFQEVQAALMALVGDVELPTKLLREALLRARPRSRVCLPFTAEDQIVPDRDTHQVRLMLPRLGAIRELADGSVEILFAGNAYQCLPEARPLLEYLEQTAPVGISKFYDAFQDEFGEDKVTLVLQNLARCGIISFQGLSRSPEQELTYGG